MRYVFYKDSTKRTENEKWYRDMSKELDMAFQLKEANWERFSQAKKMVQKV
ncbi:hypothetical protein [Bacillus andreraoultii]|uniref:hypothetical protein n=1 Tax=Bacillus andreraoultii TaxID=1499685 RepID=UPI000B2B6428|nr:hypothetical protein [Bacillus andreraoultii]